MLWSLHQQTHLGVSFFLCITFQRLLMDFTIPHHRRSLRQPELYRLCVLQTSGMHIWPHIQKESSLEITCGWDIGETLPWRYRAQRPPINWYCLQGAVGPARRSSSAVFTELSSPQLSNISTTVSALWNDIRRCVKYANANALNELN